MAGRELARVWKQANARSITVKTYHAGRRIYIKDIQANDGQAEAEGWHEFTWSEMSAQDWVEARISQGYRVGNPTAADIAKLQAVIPLGQE